MRQLLFLLLGVVLGAAAAVPGMVFFLKSDAGLSLLRAYIAPQPEWPDVAVTATSNSTEVTNRLASGSAIVGVPKLYAGAEYSDALNGALREVATIATSSQQLVTALTAINAKSLARDYNGLFDLVASAKNTIALQKGAIARFSQSLTALSAANQKTADAQTKALTQELYTKGVAFHASLEAYIAATDALLTGTIPTAQQIADANTRVEEATATGTAFSDAVKALTDRFAAAVAPAAR